MRLQFLLLQLSGRTTQVLHARPFDLAVEFEGGLIVVIDADRRAEVDAEVEAIVGRKDQRGAHRHHARRNFVAVDFQHHLERTGWLALNVGRLDFDLDLAAGSLSLALMWVRIISNRLYSYDSTPSLTYNARPPENPPSA